MQFLFQNSPVQPLQRMTVEVHTNNSWMGLDGEKHKGLCMNTSKSLEDCGMIHKLTVFNCDTAKRQKAYIYSSSRPFITT